MVKYISPVDIIEMFEKEESNPNGNIENVLHYILSLEKTDEYEQANICKFKSMYYYHIAEYHTAYEWIQQAILLSPNNTSYLFTHARYAMQIFYFKEALVSLSKVIDIEEKEGYVFGSLAVFFKAVCYYYLKDYQECYEHLKNLPDDYVYWAAGDLQRKEDMMKVLKGFGYY